MEDAPEKRAPRGPLEVGLVGSAFPPILGGMEVYLRDLSQALAHAGHAVHVAVRFVRERPPSMRALQSAVEPPWHRRSHGVDVSVLSPGRLDRLALRPVYRLHFNPWTRPAAIRLVCRAFVRPLEAALPACDVIHYSGTGREMLGFAAAEVARRRGVPFVVTPHSHAGEWGDGPIDMELYRLAHRVVALTDDERGRLIDLGIAEGRVHVIGHGVSVRGGGRGARFRARHGIEGPVVFYLGRKVAAKGYDLLRAAAEMVWQVRPDVHFVLAGPGGGGSSGAQDARLHDLNPLSDAEREDAYAACDVFCLPSAAEAFGLVYLEAWSYAKPVVALKIPTLEELIGGAGGGLLVERSASGVAGALLELLADERLRKQLGCAGARAAQPRTWESTARQTAALYREAVAAYALPPQWND